MNNEFLQTENVRNLTTALAALRTRDEGVPGLALVHGPAGRGKTRSAIWYAVRHRARYVTANPLWTPRWMLSDLYAAVKEIKGASFYSAQKAYDYCKKELDGDPTPILIDEADAVARKLILLETLRNLHDITGTPVIFIGTDEIAARLGEREQLWSRVSQKLHFAPLGAGEIAYAAKQLCGLDMDADTAADLERASKGVFRDVIVALSHLERAARTGKTTVIDRRQAAAVAERVLKKVA